MKRPHHQTSSSSSDSHQSPGDLKKMSKIPDNQEESPPEQTPSVPEAQPQVSTYPYETNWMSELLKDEARREFLASQHVPGELWSEEALAIGADVASRLQPKMTNFQRVVYGVAQGLTTYSHCDLNDDFSLHGVTGSSGDLYEFTHRISKTAASERIDNNDSSSSSKEDGLIKEPEEQ